MADRFRKILAAVTDGDVRRALLSGNSLESNAERAYNSDFFVLDEGDYSPATLAQAFDDGFSIVPVVDGNGVVVYFEIDSHDRAVQRENNVVIMAGGKGMRLRPLTDSTPKPMLEIAGKPILQRIIENLQAEGFRNILISTNYLGQQIEDYFQDGSRFGVSISYLREEQPLGTAGPLSLIAQEQVNPIVVMNGDLVFGANLATVLDYHVEKDADITVGATIVETTVPYGVLSTTGPIVDDLVEKPVYRDLANAGVYVLGPQVLAQMRANQAVDMPELIAEHIPQGKVFAFPMHETWADLGRPADLERAHRLMEE